MTFQISQDPKTGKHYSIRPDTPGDRHPLTPEGYRVAKEFLIKQQIEASDLFRRLEADGQHDKLWNSR